MNEVANYVAASDTMEAFVNAVKARMLQLGVTQVELAKRLGVHQSTINQQLKGARGNMSFASADEISRALGTTTRDLLRQ